MTHLVVVCGLPGVGKSTIARAVAGEVDAELLHTDALRKEVKSDLRYDREETRYVYALLLDRARDHLEAGETVVLDGTFRRAVYREWARDLAGRLDVDFEVARVRCDESVALQRIADRDPTMSDASLGTYYEVMKSYEDLSMDHVTIDNSRSRETTELQVRSWCAQALSP